MSLVGTHIGRYRILEQLGQGGMSVVYKGLDTSLDREVAVKVLHSHLAGKEESRRRLAREAKAVAKLHHPNILEIYDFAAAGSEQAYIVTEYIRGQTLRQYAETAGFEPPEIAAMVIHEIASALAQAHENGIIHRDLKPENVMVREDGVLKLMDFGIAKIIDRDDKMTMTGALVGSPAHMAPEIIEGEEAGPEADVFSLGTMLFYFATARLPFTAPNTTATLKRILDGVYDDPRQLVPTVSDDLAEIIATCLARQPSSRYANAVKLRDALHDYLEGLGLGRTTEELQGFFSEPSRYRKELTPRISAALLRRSEAFISEKRPAKALSSLNQILAHDPSNARALELLSLMNAARKKQRANVLWKRAALGIFGIAVLAGGSVPLVRLLLRPDEAPTIAATQTKVVATDPVIPTPVPVPDAQPGPTAVIKKPDPVVQKPNIIVARADLVPTATPIPFTVKLRPYGFIELDGAPRSAEVPQHELKLLPGEHTLKYGCTFCEMGTQKIKVSADGPRELYLSVAALPARLSFEIQPAQAMVRVQGEQRTAADSMNRPFDVRSTKGASSLRHTVKYEIFLAGFKPITESLELSPGETRIIPKTLIPE